MKPVSCKITCPKCGALFTEYGAFYEHYLSEPTPEERKDDVALFEESWRQTGVLLRMAMYSTGESEAGT